MERPKDFKVWDNIDPNLKGPEVVRSISLPVLHSAKVIEAAHLFVRQEVVEQGEPDEI